MVDFEIAPFCFPDELLQGLTYTPENVKDYGLLVLRSSNIQNGRLVFDDTIYVDCKVDSNRLVHKGDMIICVRNGSSALIGKCAIAEHDYNATWGAFMTCVRSDRNEFLYQVFQSNIVQKQIHGKSNATINQITNRDFRELAIPLPPLPEQRAIAAVLSDVDRDIAALERLIAKKRNIKQGAMQELLTGKRRLPGFDGEWVEKALFELVPNLRMGQSPASRFYNTDIQGLPLIQGNADIENRKTIIRFFTSQVTKCAYAGEIILTVRAPVGTVAKAAFECCLGRGVCGFSYPNEYLYQWLINFEPFWGSLSTGSTFDSISGNKLKEVVVGLPEDEAEQSAIAAVLSDMDAEIDALMAKLVKIRNLKQGMMQELLTGRIRLVSEEAEPAPVVKPATKVIELPKCDP